MKYSFIIPVYNGDKYIKDAVNSVLNRMENFEIILIDDGSYDNSWEICRHIANEYQNVFVYHTENLGAGNARNIGIQKASGDFVVFLDSDDLISKDFFDNISEAQKQSSCDVIFFKTVRLLKNGYKKPMNEGFKAEEIAGKDKSEVLRNITGFNKFPASCSGKIIKRTFLTDNNIYFLTGILGEDVDFTLNLLIKGNKFGYYSGGTYIYRQCYSSRSAKGYKKSVEDLIYTIEKWVLISQNSKYKDYILSYLAYEYAMTFPFLGALDKRERKMFLEKMKELQYILKYGKTNKIKSIKVCAGLLGIENTAKLLNYYVNTRDNR